ncbi:MAG: hypothetical protein JXA93_06525 [Anaerolineae bacterium]|nr:hypothetical protein [Anaerolineae bacterium]
MRNRLFIFAVALIASSLILGCTLSRGPSAHVTATPTKTPHPMFTTTFTPEPTVTSTNTPLPTDTPIPPTDTPVPTDTPAPTDTPLPTGTPLSPTEAVPSDTPPPTDTPAPAVPSNTPRPAATNTSAPPTNTPQPKVDYRVTEQKLMTREANEAQRHMVLIRVIDAGGNPLHGLVVWDANHPDQEAVTGSKPEPYHAEYTFWNYDAYQFEIKGANGEKTKVLSTDVFKISIEDLITAGYCADAATCNQGELVQHFTWYVTFQRTW